MKYFQVITLLLMTVFLTGCGSFFSNNLPQNLNAIAYKNQTPITNPDLYYIDFLTIPTVNIRKSYTLEVNTGEEIVKTIVITDEDIGLTGTGTFQVDLTFSK